MSERDLFLNGRSQLVLSIGSVTKCVFVFVRDREREKKARERESERERRTHERDARRLADNFRQERKESKIIFVVLNSSSRSLRRPCGCLALSF